MSTIHDVPKFKHNCDSCVFLTRVLNKYGKILDAYICKNVNIHEIVMRYGDEPDQYKTPYWTDDGLEEAFNQYGLSEQDIDLLFDKINEQKWRDGMNEALNRHSGGLFIYDDLEVFVRGRRMVRKYIKPLLKERKENNG